MNIHTMFDFNLPSGFIISLRSKVKVPQRSLRYVTHRLMVMHPHTKYHWPISKDKNVMVQTRKYYLKNNYLTFRSNVKVPSRSLWYKTHRLMVMHPHTKYHWPISKDKKWYAPDKKILFKKQLFDLQVKGHGTTKVIMVHDKPPYGHAPTYQISLTYLERQKSYGPEKLHWEEAEAEEKNQTKIIYISLRSKRRHN
jgi:hypothetical protein